MNVLTRKVRVVHTGPWGSPADLTVGIDRALAHAPPEAKLIQLDTLVGDTYGPRGAGTDGRPSTGYSAILTLEMP